jgi:hypothetical protein
MWFVLEIRKWQLRGSKKNLDEEFNTWPGSVALGSELFQFLFFCAVSITSDWIWAVGSFGGNRRAVTAGRRKGPCGD